MTTPPTGKPRPRTVPQFNADDNGPIPTPDTYPSSRPPVRPPVVVAPADFPVTAVMQLGVLNDTTTSMHDTLRQILAEAEAIRHEARRRRQPPSLVGMTFAVICGLIIACALILAAVKVADEIRPEGRSGSTFTPGNPSPGGTTSNVHAFTHGGN